MSGGPTHWLYPVNQGGDYVLSREGRDGAEVPVTPETVWEDVQAVYPRSTSWILSKGFRIMQPGDLIWVYASTPFRYLCAVARAVDVSRDEVESRYRVEMVWDLELSRVLHAQPLTRDRLGGQHIQSVQRANEVSIQALDSWLAYQRVTPRVPADPEWPGSETEARAWTLQQVRRRQGQTHFRDLLLQHYRERCAVTGETCRDVLEAAHIEPFAIGENHAVANGILLRSDLHTLFDLHLIGVDQGGGLVVSPKVTSPTYRALAGRKLLVPESKPARPSISALAEHLDALLR